MIILGLNAFHGDSSACIVRDGKLIAAAEEERFRRVKHWAGFPSLAIRYCLSEAGVRLRDVDRVAINQDSRANLGRKIAHVLRKMPDPAAVLQRIRNRRARSRLSVSEYLEEVGQGEKFTGKIDHVEHHLSHMFSAYYVSPFKDAAIVSVDGFGDFCSTVWGRGENGRIAVEGRVYFPHSLGVFYQALTQYLGFPHYGDEYKVMGLAPYGNPSCINSLYEIVSFQPGGGFELDLSYFRHHIERIPYQWLEGPPEVGDLFSPKLESLLGPRRSANEPITSRHHDIARSVQAIYEEAFFHLLRTMQKNNGLTDIALAGGCAANSVANGKIRRHTPFRRVYVQPAAGDAGGAIGAAYAVWDKQKGGRSFVMNHAYWGPQFSASTISELVMERRAEIENAGCVVEEVNDELELCRRVANAIADGSVVGWFQGRMEWGPRALGNRSIVCDPRRADMKSILNEKIKRRESFRPFAPSILDDAVMDWFEEGDAVPFMMQVFQIREDRRALIPAVTHVDGSGRLQTVSQSDNPRYYRLIKSFYEITAVPMVLNTSFNENEPIVCEPQQALACFLRTKMDMLVLGNTLIMRYGTVT